MHIRDLASPFLILRRLWMEPGWSDAKNIIVLTAHPRHIQVLGDGALVERADRSRRSDRDSPNARAVAQMRAELWPETWFHPNGALVERAGRSRRSDRDSPNERSVVQMRAELWPET